MNYRVLRIKDVAERVGRVNVSTVKRWAANPQLGFPKPLRLGPGTVGWLESDIAGWLESRAAVRDAEVAAVATARAEAGLAGADR